MQDNYKTKQQPSHSGRNTTIQKRDQRKREEIMAQESSPQE